MVHSPSPSETDAPREQLPRGRRRGLLVVLLAGLGLAFLALTLAVRLRPPVPSSTRPADAAGGHLHDATSTAPSAAALPTASQPPPAEVRSPDASVAAEASDPSSAKAESLASDNGGSAAETLWSRLVEELPVLPSRDELDRTVPQSKVPIPGTLSAWLERTPSAGLRLGRVRLGNNQVQTFEGLGKLQVPWREGLVLRMWWLNVSQLRLHAFHGTSGATLVYHPERPRGWAAYVTTRAEGEATPRTLALAALHSRPDTSARLNETGPLDLFFHGGRLVLAVGARRLLSVPLPGPPSELFVEGRAMVRGLTLAKVGDLDTDPATVTPIAKPASSPAATWLEPANQPWKPWQIATDSPGDSRRKKEKKAGGAETASREQLAQMQPKRSPDGGLHWEPGLRSQPVAWYAPLPGDVPCLVDVQLENVGAGLGIYLGDKEGKPQCLVRIVHDGKLQAAHWQEVNDAAEVSLPSWHDRPVALVGTSLWLRLVAGCGQVRFWVSSDGRHWVEPHPPKMVSSLPMKTLGVYLPARVPTAGGTLRKIVVRPLAQLAALAAAGSVPRDVSWSGDAHGAKWLAWAEQQRPPDVPREAWYGQLALRTLSGGLPTSLGSVLLEALLEDASRRGLPLKQQVDALEEALLLVGDVRDNGAMRRALFGRLLGLGLLAAEQRDWGVCDRVRGIMEGLPPHLAMYAAADISRLERWQWIQAAYDDPDEYRGVLKRWQLPNDASGLARLGEWVRWQQARQTDPAAVPEGGTTVPEAWRDLLIEETDAEAYRIVAELQAAVQSAAWEDAARIVMRIDPTQAKKLAACPWEAGLWTTVRQTVEIAYARFPPLRQAIAQHYGEWGREWVEQAAAAGQRERLELAAWQLAGTPAARRAHRWLADQALADGSFAEALRHYEAVADDPLQAAEVGPRRRLAAALLGRDLGQPPTQPVALGEQTLSPEAFETLVDEARQRARSAASDQPPAGAALPPGKLEVRTLPVSVPIGAPLPSSSAGNVASSEGTWALRHLASMGDGSRLVTSTRRQFFATDLDAAKRLWAEPPNDPLPPSAEFLGTPTRPVVASGRACVRWLVGAETQLLCLDIATGRVLWKWNPAPAVISDPVLVGDAVVVLGLSRQMQRQLRVHYYALDPHSGTVRHHSELVLVRESWAARDCVLLSGDDEGLVAALGGVSLGIDPEGALRWVRTHVAVPPEEDPRWVLQRFQPPLFDHEHVFLVQPGVWTVDCLHRSTGQLQWRRVMPELVGLIGTTKGTSVVRSLGEIRGLAADTGELRWRHASSGVLDGLIVGPHVLVLRRTEAGPGKLRRVEALWLDGQTGAVAGQTLVPGLEGAAPAVGCLSSVPQGLAMWFQPDGQQATAHLRLLRTQQPLPATWQPPTPWEALAEEASAP